MRTLARTGAGAALGLVLTLGALGAAPGSAAPVTAVAAPSAAVPAASFAPAALAVPAATQVSRGPSRILLTPGPGTTSTQRISWTMRAKTGGMRLQVKVSGSSKVRSLKATRRAATAAKYAGTASPRYTVVLKKLKPGTRYSYRIVTKRGTTKWRSFKTADPRSTSLTLIGLGDMQVDNRGVPKQTVKQALARAPKAAAILQAGDVVNNPTSDTQWGDLFNAIGESGRTRNWMVSIGNHEHCLLISCNSNHAQAFRSYFPWPSNAFPGQGPTWFFLDYPGARVIVLDSFAGSPTVQAAFLDRALATNRQPFSIVVMHAPLFASAPKRTNNAQVAAFLPVLERRNADLVLTGHDHSYARGYRTPNGTAYVTSVSGPKYYPVSDKDWRKRKATRVIWAQGTSTYQVISIKGRTLSYRAYVSHRGASSTSPFGAGGLLDSFVIDKSRPGDKIVR